MADEFVELFERAFVEEQVDAFARAEFSLLVFALAAFGATACFGFDVELAKLFEAVSVFAVAGHSRTPKLEFWDSEKSRRGRNREPSFLYRLENVISFFIKVLRFFLIVHCTD
jgi:hypothetical protein